MEKLFSFPWLVFFKVGFQVLIVIKKWDFYIHFLCSSSFIWLVKKESSHVFKTWFPFGVLIGELDSEMADSLRLCSSSGTSGRREGRWCKRLAEGCRSAPHGFPSHLNWGWTEATATGFLHIVLYKISVYFAFSSQP